MHRCSVKHRMSAAQQAADGDRVAAGAPAQHLAGDLLLLSEFGQQQQTVQGHRAFGADVHPDPPFGHSIAQTGGKFKC